MKNFKKALALILSLMMVFSAISVVFSMPVSAAEAGDAYSVAINASNYTSYYNADLTTLCDANGNAVENYTSRLVASNNIQVANSRGYSNNQHPMLVAATNKEGYAILKFDDFNSKYLSAATLSYEGKANDSGDAINVYISSTFDESAPTGDYWTRVNGTGHGDNYTTANSYGNPQVVDITDYIEKGVSALYVRIHFNNTGAVSQTVFSNLIIDGRLRDYQYEETREYNVALGNNFYDAENTENNTFGADADYIVASNAIQGSTRTDLGGSTIIPNTKNTDAYAIFKFAPEAGSIFTEASLKWSGRGIQNADNWVNVYVGDSVDGDWIYLDGVGHNSKGYAADNNINNPATIDLTGIIGDGIDAIYVKVVLRTNQTVTMGWASLKTLAVTGKYTAGTKDAEVNDYIFSSELGGDIYVGDVQTATVTPNPFWIDDAAITASSNSDALDVKVEGNKITATATDVGAATLTVTAGDKSYTYNYNIAASWINEDFDKAITVSSENKVNAEDFYDFAAVTAPMAKKIGATVKLSGVSFAEFKDAGSNFVKANVSWGATGNGVASFDVYADSIDAANKIATLYATPFGSSITAQTVTGYMSKVLKDTHDIYVVFNTPGSALIDISFGNFAGDYTGNYSRDYSDATATPDWVTKVINYHGLRATTGGAMGAKYGTDATIIYRVDATEGKTLTGFNYTLDGRYISDGKIANTVLYVYASADMNNWTLLNTISGKGDPAIGSNLLANNVLENVVSNGAETVYFKLVMNVPQSGGLDSWNILQQVKLNPVENDGVLGDTNADGVVDIVDLVRFKKVQAGIALVSDIADTAYFAGKNNTANDLIYTRKTIIGVDFDVDRSAFEPVVATELPAQSPESKTPTIFEAMSLPVTTSVDATAEYNADRIQFCLDNYGFVTLQSGEYYEIDSAIVLDGKNEVLKTEDPEKPAELSLWGDSWYVVQVKGTNNTLKDVIVNQNLNYTTGIHLDTAVVQVVDATNALLDGVTVMGDSEPESADTTYATGDIGTSYPAALYVLRSTAPVIKNSTFRNCFYGVIFHSSQTVEMNAVMDNCLVTYNRCDGITLAGYAQIKNSEICYNGYDCMNGGDGDPIPGAGIYVEANQVGFVIDNCEIYRNNGFNVDVNGAANGIITNNTIYDAGWTTFPEATDYVKVTYHNGVSLAISGLVGGTVTGNTVTNTNAATVLSDCYAHKVYGNDINGFFGYNNTGTAFGDIPERGNIIVACFIARGSSNVTVEGNTFTAEAEGVTGYAIFVDYISSATIGENTTTGNVLQAVAVETEE